MHWSYVCFTFSHRYIISTCCKTLLMLLIWLHDKWLLCWPFQCPLDQLPMLVMESIHYNALGKELLGQHDINALSSGGYGCDLKFVNFKHNLGNEYSNKHYHWIMLGVHDVLGQINKPLLEPVLSQILSPYGVAFTQYVQIYAPIRGV